MRTPTYNVWMAKLKYCLMFSFINSLQRKALVFTEREREKIDWFYIAHEGLMKVIVLREGVISLGQSRNREACQRVPQALFII